MTTFRIFLTLVALLIGNFASAQYFGFDLNQKLYVINSKSEDYPFYKTMDGYSLVQPVNLEVDSSALIQFDLSNTFFDKNNIAMFKNELVGDDFQSNNKRHARLVGLLVTNNDYSQLMSYTRDSTAHTLLGIADYPAKLGNHFIEYMNGKKINYPVCVDPPSPDIFKFYINWKQPIMWENGDVAFILEDPNFGIITPEFERLNRIKTIDNRKLNYSFSCFVPERTCDLLSKSDTNAYDYLKNNYLSYMEFRTSYVFNTNPDIFLWLFELDSIDLNLKVGLCKYYFTHPYFADYPVIGLSYGQRIAYLSYRSKLHTQLVQKYNKNDSLMVNYRFPEAYELEGLPKENYIISIDTTTLFDGFRITEYEYYEFLKWTADSVLRTGLGNYGVVLKSAENDFKKFYYCNSKGYVVEFGDLLVYPKLDWSKKLDLRQADILSALKKIGLLDENTNQIKPDSIVFTYQEFDYHKYMTSDQKVQILIDASALTITEKTNVFPLGKFGEDFLQNYGKKTLTKETIERMQNTQLTNITYLQAVAYYHWRNARLAIPHASNPLDYYTIPSEEQWNQIIKGETVQIATTINLGDLIDKNKPKIETVPFRPIVELFDFKPIKE